MDPIEPYSRQDNLLQAEIEQLKLDLEFEMKKMEGDEKQREMREKSYLARLATLENQLEKANYELHVTTIATRSELREKRAKKKKEDPEVSIGKLQVKNRKLQKNIEEEKENGLDGKLMVVWMEGQRDRRVPRCGECGEEYDEKVKVPKVMGELLAFRDVAWKLFRDKSVELL